MTALTLALGMFSWTFAEYALHAWIGHRTSAHDAGARSHRAHHRDPSNGLSAPVKAALVAAVLVPASGAAVWAGSTSALAFVAGLGLAFGVYDQLHARGHDTPPGNPYGRWARRHHLLHHRDPRVNFGVTTPLWDWLFGTLAAPARIEVERSRAPWWLVDEDGALKARFADDYVLVGRPLRSRRPAARLDSTTATSRR